MARPPGRVPAAGRRARARRPALPRRPRPRGAWPSGLLRVAWLPRSRRLPRPARAPARARLPRPAGQPGAHGGQNAFPGQEGYPPGRRSSPDPARPRRRTRGTRHGNRRARPAAIQVPTGTARWSTAATTRTSSVKTVPPRRLPRRTRGDRATARASGRRPARDRRAGVARHHRRVSTGGQARPGGTPAGPAQPGGHPRDRPGAPVASRGSAASGGPATHGHREPRRASAHGRKPRPR